MASQCLWTVDCFGSLHRLDLASMELERLCQYDPNTRQNTFKRIATSASCMWGIGGDQNVYMKVFTTDSPIIATEEYYENERWYMSLGFSKKSVSSYLLQLSKYPTNTFGQRFSSENKRLRFNHHAMRFKVYKRSLLGKKILLSDMVSEIGNFSIKLIFVFEIVSNFL